MILEKQLSLRRIYLEILGLNPIAISDKLSMGITVIENVHISSL